MDKELEAKLINIQEILVDIYDLIAAKNKRIKELERLHPTYKELKNV